MMFTPLQLPSVNHNPSFSKIVNRSSDHTSSESVANNYHQETGNPSCDGCARDTEENTIWTEFGQQNVAKERLSVIYTFQKAKEIKNGKAAWKNENKIYKPQRTIEKILYHIIYIMTMPWILQHCLFKRTYMQHATNCVAKCVHPNM